MALSPNLNRRHEAGLFLALLAVGLSLYLEASAKQTAGVVLFGIAFAWLFGSVSMRVLSLSLCLLVCAVGAALAGFPLWQEWSLYQAKAEDYDSMMSEIQAAVTAPSAFLPPDVVQHPTLGTLSFPKSMPYDERNRIISNEMVAKSGKPVPIPKGATISPLPADSASPNTRERIAIIDGDGSRTVLKFPPSTTDDVISRTVKAYVGRSVKSDFPPAAGDCVVEIPEGTWRWVRPEQNDISDKENVEFPDSMSEQEITNFFRTKILLPRPKFSLGAAIVTHRTPFFSGVVLVTVGLAGLCLVLWRARSESRLVDASPNHPS
jgi:hypothetical protein